MVSLPQAVIGLPVILDGTDIYSVANSGHVGEILYALKK